MTTNVIQGAFVGGRPPCTVPQARSFVQRSANGFSLQLPENLLHSRRDPGEAIPGPVREKMEKALGANFSDVRIHVGPEASAIGALAFAHGTDIYFASGQYNPHTPHGQRLLGHELTHVVQQRVGRVRNPFGSGVAVVQDPNLEAEAERLGRLAAAQPTMANGPLRAVAAHVQAALGGPVQPKAAPPQPPRPVAAGPAAHIQAALARPGAGGPATFPVAPRPLPASPIQASFGRGPAPAAPPAPRIVPVPPAPRRPLPTQAVPGAVQMTKGTLKILKVNDVYQIEGRPDFDTAIKSETYAKAEENGETYMVEHSLNNGKSFRIPTIHRRHRVAWDLWKRSMNKALMDDDRQDFNEILSLARLSIPPLNRNGFDRVREKGTSLLSYADQIFNRDWNIWIGPGDENQAKGAQIKSTLEDLLENRRSKTFYKKALSSVSDPRNKRKILWDDPNLKWVYEKIRERSLTPDTRHGVEVSNELLYHTTGSKYAKRARTSSWDWEEPVEPRGRKKARYQ